MENKNEVPFLGLLLACTLILLGGKTAQAKGAYQDHMDQGNHLEAKIHAP